MTEQIKRMSVKEFREHGYLQEVNRQFLHPLGLALEVVIDDNGNERFGEIWDCREDLEGIAFIGGMIDVEKLQTIDVEKEKRIHPRMTKLGYYIQTQ